MPENKKEFDIKSLKIGDIACIYAELECDFEDKSRPVHNFGKMLVKSKITEIDWSKDTPIKMLNNVWLSIEQIKGFEIN